MIKEYRTEDLVIYWDQQKCAHAGMCWAGLPRVFQPSERPWIKLSNATPAQIINTVDQCPSGALKYKLTQNSSIDSALAKGFGSLKE